MRFVPLFRPAWNAIPFGTTPGARRCVTKRNNVPETASAAVDLWHQTRWRSSPPLGTGTKPDNVPASLRECHQTEWRSTLLVRHAPNRTKHRNVRMGAGGVGVRTLTKRFFHSVSVPCVQNALTERKYHSVSASWLLETLTERKNHSVSALYLRAQSRILSNTMSG